MTGDRRIDLKGAVHTVKGAASPLGILYRIIGLGHRPEKRHKRSIFFTPVFIEWHHNSIGAPAVRESS